MGKVFINRIVKQRLAAGNFKAQELELIVCACHNRGILAQQLEDDARAFMDALDASGVRWRMVEDQNARMGEAVHYAA